MDNIEKMKFEEFWSNNQETYMQKARQDFERLQNGKFEARVVIDTDDDFSLDIGYDFTVYAKTEEELTQKLIATLENAKVLNGKYWSVTHEDGRKEEGNMSEHWNYIRDEAIAELKDPYGSTYISIGGNQTITIDRYEIAPEINSAKKLKF